MRSDTSRPTTTGSTVAGQTSCPSPGSPGFVSRRSTRSRTPVPVTTLMAASELDDGVDFAPEASTRSGGDQTDLGTTWSPRYVRVAGAMPVTATRMIDEPALRRRLRYAEGDPVHAARATSSRSCKRPTWTASASASCSTDDRPG